MSIFSWGGTIKVSPEIHKDYDSSLKNNLVCGNLLSYGDVCLNSKNITINNHKSKIISFDYSAGIIHVESGISIKELLDFSMKELFFLHVTPGTKNITIGGAVANNVHGKEHHLFGAFGNWITEIELENSNGHFICNSKTNTDLFYSTIGGLGLTGYIKTVKLKLRKVPGNQIKRKTVKFNSIHELLELFKSHSDTTYTVSWFDSFSCENKKTKGLFYSGEFTDKTSSLKANENRYFQFLPSFLLNKLTMKIFNILNYKKHFKKITVDEVHFNDFFYPLDKIVRWNRIYGKQGFFQFQCVLPFETFEKVFFLLMKEAKDLGSFLSVIKVMKNEKKGFSPFSFPMKGVSIALDFKNSIEAVDKISKMNNIVSEYGGRIYLAKDALLTKNQFNKMYDSSLLDLNKDSNLSSVLLERISSD